MAHLGADRRYQWSGYLLGFALGGFFDGILLHQILQWHHLLSTINTDDIRFQVAADGYFHALMYGVAAIGLWLLWASRSASGQASGRLLLAFILIGFGAWHAVDAVLSHWLLGIHRVRMDRGNPLFWDLLWLGLFGVAPLIVGLVMRGPRDGGSSGLRSSGAARSIAALLVTGAGALALWPPQGSEFTTVLFAPGTSPARIFGAIASVDARLVWTDPSGELVVIRMAEGRSGLKLFGQGAILVTGAGLPAGCLNYLRV
ncbi:DUF2243 domain-containing protein [Microvirga aerilata]|uniref:DUF2243 domain-containing protein n=1 Tax=Microvirga aerilata TaxID=670292 RepID=A0A937CY13_9HYPH|nr:DUF2243 domain-containing protein [Microvirga aerilata]MBL0404924.1 DUF2243 domain-containing protein [Microvirga aerilata]